MVSTVALFVLGVTLPVAGFVLWNGIQELRTVYHILTNDPVSVRDLPTRSGPVEVEGRAQPADEAGTVHTPFTDTDCLAYEYEAQEYQSQGQHSAWKTLDEGGESASFLVEDDTGAVRVDPAGAELHLDDHTIEVSPGEEPPERVAQYIRQTEDVDPQDGSIDLVVTELNLGNRQRFVERRLDVGEDVYVYGTVGPAPGGEWGSRLVDARIEAGPELPEFVISDTSERGTAWRIGKRAVGVTAIGLAILLGGVLVAVLVA